MKYEEPKMEVVEIKSVDIVCDSDIIDVKFDVNSGTFC